nr:gibberellin 2-beta-dioxygenase 8 [Tanacetum cinerariifolium]
MGIRTCHGCKLTKLGKSTTPIHGYGCKLTKVGSNAMEQFATMVSDLAENLAEILAEQLGHKSDFFRKNCLPSTCYVRMNRYPPCPISSQVYGLMPHTDSDFITILYQDQIGGLQLVKHGKWIAVKPNKDALIINIGDLFQAWSNDVYKSIEHRVVANTQSARFSTAYFFCPSYDTMIQSCVENSVYRTFSFREFRQQVRDDVKRLGYKIGLPRKVSFLGGMPAGDAYGSWSDLDLQQHPPSFNSETSQSLTQPQQVDSQKKGGRKKTKSKRGKNVEDEPVAAGRWLPVEEELLATCYVAVWKIITLEGHKSMKRKKIQKRTKDMLTSKWHTLNANCQRFNTAYKRAKRLGKSGKNNVDVLKRAQSIYRDEHKGVAFCQEDAWAILKFHPKWDAPEQVDLTGDVHGATQENLFGHDARPRPTGKPRPAKKTKSDATASTGGSSASTQFGELMEHELRLKREAAEGAFEAQAEKDRTLMRLEELRFLATSTKDLDDDDAYCIKKQKRLIKNKMRNDLGDEDDEDDASTQFGELIEHELRLKREAAEGAFEAQAEKDRTLMRLEELRFLATSTKDLDDDDAYWINKQKRLIKNKMRNDLGDEDDEDE